ncbi:MAG: LacI family DNA-binding transcriptional regulator [Clostridia bacterium]|jgi:DNA-binding LacI/PurR family transcriptional regulator
MAVTIKDVAKATGLSLSTISKYINGGSVREYNKKKIDEAIEKLGFSPNSMARGLRSSKTYSVGLVIPFLKDGYQAQIAANFENVLQEAGYTVVLCCHRDDIVLANEALRFLAERKVDGVIFNALPNENMNFDPLIYQNIPVVIYEQRIHPDKFDCITVDSAAGAYEAVEHLILQGYKRIATITGDLRNNTAVERYRGYRRVLDDYCIPFDSSLVYEGKYDVISGFTGMNTLWQQTERPDALFTANYHMCVGAISATQRLHINIPSDLAIVTFDDMEFSQLVHPTLTSIKQPIDQLISAVISILFKRINGDYSDPIKYLRIKPDLVVRDSSPFKVAACRMND